MDEKEPKIGRKRIMKIVGKALIAIGAIYVCIWLWFLLDGGFPTGGLGKEGWLGFLGDFLGFAGSLTLGYVAFHQNEMANKATDKANEATQKALEDIKKANESKEIAIREANRKVELLTEQANEISALQLKCKAYSLIELEKVYYNSDGLWFVFDGFDKATQKIEFRKFRLYEMGRKDDEKTQEVIKNVLLNRKLSLQTKRFSNGENIDYSKVTAKTDRETVLLEKEFFAEFFNKKELHLQYKAKIYNAFDVVTVISCDARLVHGIFWGDNCFNLEDAHTSICDIDVEIKKL